MKTYLQIDGYICTQHFLFDLLAAPLHKSKPTNKIETDLKFQMPVQYPSIT